MAKSKIKNDKDHVLYEDDILEIFPELKESKNERIKRDIIETLRYGLACEESVLMPGATTTLKEAIAWLERQGKQILANSVQTCKEEQKPTMIQWKGDNLKEVIDFTGKSPKFDEWFNTWSDFENYVHSHNDILKLFCEDGSHCEVPVGAWIVRTPDGYNVASQATYKQKAAEWSEEDEKIALSLNKL